jgi:hypothetical protein
VEETDVYIEQGGEKEGEREEEEDKEEDADELQHEEAVETTDGDGNWAETTTNWAHIYQAIETVPPIASDDGSDILVPANHNSPQDVSVLEEKEASQTASTIGSSYILPSGGRLSSTSLTEVRDGFERVTNLKAGITKRR